MENTYLVTLEFNPITIEIKAENERAAIADAITDALMSNWLNPDNVNVQSIYNKNDVVILK
jgi:hypothetical protein